MNQKEKLGQGHREGRAFLAIGAMSTGSKIAMVILALIVPSPCSPTSFSARSRRDLRQVERPSASTCSEPTTRRP